MKFKRLATVAMAAVIGASVLSGCGVKNDEIIATLGDVEVKAGTVNFMSKMSQYMADDFYTMYYGENYWTQSSSSSSSETNFETLRKSQLDAVHSYYTLANHMGDYNVVLSDEDLAQIKKSAKEFIEKNSEDALKEMSGETEFVEEYFRLRLIEQRMYDEIIKGADTEVSDKDANMRGYSAVTIGISTYYDENYQVQKYTDEEVKELKDKAAKIVMEVKAGKKLEDAAKAVELEVEKDAYAADDSSLPEDVKKKLDSLKEGETSEIITTDTTLYIVRLDSETDKKATEEKRESIIKERQDKFFQDKLEEMQKNDGWTVNEKVAKKIKFTCHFTSVDPNAEPESESATTEDTEDTEDSEDTEDAEDTEESETEE